VKELTNVKPSEILSPQATQKTGTTFLSSAYYTPDGKPSKIWAAKYMNNRGSSHLFIHSPQTMLLYILCMGELLMHCEVLSLEAWLRKKSSEGQQARQCMKVEENKELVQNIISVNFCVTVF
jgi:hypothetical protein